MNKYNAKIFLIYFFLVVGSTLMFSSWVKGASNTIISDPQITAAVNAKLAADPVTASSGINVNVDNGVVTLTGNVKTNQEVDNAVENAESVNGVSDVDSQITVADSAQPLADTLITAKVKGIYMRENLFGDNNVSVSTIHVETKDGVVYLSGKANKEQAHNAEELAKSIKNVKRVVSHIRILK